MLCCILSFSASAASTVNAYRHSQLELGFGAVSLSTPDYAGSSNNQNHFLPFPYVKYRGKKLHVDDGAEFRLFNSPDLKLSLSGNGSLPSSENNPERQGMKKLVSTIELGPSLEYRLKHKYHNSVWLEIPLRAAITLNKELDFVGLTMHPRIAWRKPAHFKYDWKLRFAAGPVFSDSEYLGYYYNVESDEVTATRSAYNATQGYSGFRTDFTYSRRIQNYWLGGFVRHDSISSHIEDSPLVTETSNLTVGIALAWVFSEQ